MRIREAIRDDEREIVEELLQPAYRDSEATAPAFNELDEEAVADADCSRWLDHDDRTLFVAEMDGDLVGHVSGLLTDAPAIYTRGTQLHLDGLYVKPEFRRQGVASSLVDRIETWAEKRDCEYVGVTVHVNDEMARQFYDERFDLTFYSYRKPIQ